MLAACTRGPEGVTEAGGGAQPDARPNVLVIVTDDQPIGTLEVMPETRRYFADEGAHFTNSYATTPTCCPARASLMTGRYAHNHRVRNNEEAHRLDQSTTVQAHLRESGYRTALIGKYLNRWTEDPPHFDRWAVKTGARRHRFVGTTWKVDGAPKQTVPGYWTKPFTAYVRELVRDLGADPSDPPWLLYLMVPAPHAPYLPAPEHEDAPLPAWDPGPVVGIVGRDDKPDYVRRARAGLDDAARVRAGQLRSLMAVDDVVAAAMTAIEEIGETNTLAFFASDNGYLWGDHGLLGHNLSKGAPYARSVRVPILMRWPGHVDGGAVDPRFAGLIDIAPTIYAATGTEPPALDGRSLLDDWDRDRILNQYWKKRGHHRSFIPDWASLRTAAYSYVEYYEGGRISFREYYDLTRDPHELENLLGDADPGNDPDVEALHRQLERDRKCTTSSCP